MCTSKQLMFSLFNFIVRKIKNKLSVIPCYDELNDSVSKYTKIFLVSKILQNIINLDKTFSYHAKPFKNVSKLLFLTIADLILIAK